MEIWKFFVVHKNKFYLCDKDGNIINFRLFYTKEEALDLCEMYGLVMRRFVIKDSDLKFL